MQKFQVDERFFKPPGGENSLDVFSRARKFLLNLINENVKSEFVKNFKDESFSLNFNEKFKAMCDIGKKEIDFFSHKGDNENFRISIEMLPDMQTENKILEEKENLVARSFAMVEEEQKIVLNSAEDEILTRKEKAESNFFSFLSLDHEAKKILTDKKFYDLNKIDVYEKKEIETAIEKFDLSQLEKLPYSGYNASENVKRILIVSHSGFISEMINVIKLITNIKLHDKHHTINTGLYVIRIFCKHCGISTKCKNEIECSKDDYELEFDFVLENDISHLACIKYK
jgi:hypothetical protein